MDTDRYPPVIREGVEAEVPVRLVSKANPRFQVARE
jgi:hypothetical protein